MRWPLDALTRQSVDPSTPQCVVALTRRHLNASTRRRIAAPVQVKWHICIKNFGFALRLRTFVQKFLTWGHNPQPQPQTQPSDHGSWICILWWRRRGLRPLWGDHKMQIQDPWSDGCVCGCGCGLCPQVKNFCTKVLNLRAKPKFLKHITAFIFVFSKKKWMSKFL